MKKNTRKSLLLIFGSIVSWSLMLGVPIQAATEDEQIALKLATLLRSSRKVISDNQDLINEQKTGKNLTAQRVLEEGKANYAKATGQPFPTLNKATKEGKLLQAEIDSIQEVMTDAQTLINDPNLGFKGFLPAVFAKRVADAFKPKVGEEAYLKLTAPKELIRNRANRPDPWEDSVIKTKFQGGGWEKGKAFSETTDLNGKKAYRLLIPEYYGPSCLSCHGDPKGELDITGGKKEGMKLEDLGGAVSAAIYLK